MDKMSGETIDLTKKNIEKLKQLFPEIISEGDKIDFDKLKMIMGNAIDDQKERYNFTWHGKKESMLGAQKPSKGTLRPDKEKSKNFDTTENLYIEGDNLETLKLLQKSYNNKIKVIYIDPPYNTGNDFVYKDNFKDGVENYLEQTGQVDSEGNQISTNSESQGRYHSNWLNMVYPRLKLARKLLADNGVIFMSIDDAEFANLKKISDEIFGENNYIGSFVWKRKKKGSFLNKKLRKMTEYLLCYEKNANNEVRFFGEKAYDIKLQPIVKRTNSIKELVFSSKLITTSLPDGYYKPGRYKDGPTGVEFLSGFNVKNGLVEDKIVVQGRFVWNQDFLDAELLNGTTVDLSSQFGFNVGRHNQLEKFKAPSSIINSTVGVGTNEDGSKEIANLFNKEQGEIFDFPKPTSYLKYIINMRTVFEKDDIIMDFFSGSATTAHATMELNAEDGGNRKFIMVQLPEPLDEKSEAYKDGYRTICDIGEERIRRAGEKVKHDLIQKNNKNELLSENQVNPDNLDIGFKVFKLDKSNIKEWNIDFDNIDQIDLYENIFVEGRSELDIVYEILLKNGIELTYPINTFEIGNKQIYDVAYGNLFICLSDVIDTSVAKAIVEKRRKYDIETSSVVFKDAGFNGNDSEKLNVIEILKDAEYTDEQLLTI